MVHGWRVALGTGAILLGLGVAASADTLQMKNGSVIQGKYLGGSERAVQFEVDGKIQLYNLDQVLSITFTGDSANGGRTSGRASEAVAATAAGDAGVTVPAGTRLVVRMIDSVDSSKNHVGDRFRASLESDLLVNGLVVATKGTDVYGRLSQAEEAGHLTGKAELKLELTDILIHNQMQPIMTGDYEVAGKSRGGNTATKAAGGAAVGAIIGALAGGGKGAAVGAGVGAGAGTAVNVVTRGDQVRVPSEAVLDFRLEQAFTTPGN